MKASKYPGHVKNCNQEEQKIERSFQEKLAFDEECYKQEQHALKKYSNNRFEPQKRIL